MPSKEAAKLTVSLRMNRVPGDGSRCLQCGDQIFLEGGELELVVGPKVSKSNPFKGRLFCQSCAQVLEEGLEEVEENNDGQEER